ncbi:MAG: cell division protein FtsH [Candidatus Portnoybacteria bacterium RIFCSPLOWO2_12_FULL_39_9]|uniref:ATP-dependent zinc metalloprotease FtsH n=1 Tax=Candidatus Portnoybacteria bacterium RIFCSPHIGHO2_12_FULL_38_9 TaxID=1801997 RepID=A0A1G2FIL9_9BACT|nr:MAG: cell division protein FtsH [Candidatus Portnoybacteria bacterium RBG_13_40_8]OGZ37001.1 MAG: cell division protein FtsH [Candidatus Portnoybacteria bacterium RIFCSPHIGHO2_02_FULL_39_12]OGZ37632.1 MAG: cell division protein FtsH [Candidatus Portnoybacteria bacterium RIFCSPHIGHO2_12_FULL_38_9]OGZ39296.1 MAG: cell division protein FtsH [Candidatus Portnoybacteria bacterium RIFCSPLOWO2_01_FULL_38_39]OGZ39645.1 MAG: cell division protein FtsH [Candidatus Portnoybacteria bacterium RIFCSPLOWO2
MMSLIKNLLIAFLIFLIISGLFTLLNNQAEKAEVISLSRLVEQINLEQVNRIVIRGDKLEIELKNGDKKTTAKEKEISLTESLKNYGVDPEKLKLANLDVKEESGLIFWLGAILPFLLPLLIVALFFWYMFRGAQKGTMQAFSFGRSKAKLFTPKDGKEKVTFNDVAGLKEAKEELEEIVEFLKNPKKFTQLGAKIPKGVLLVGAPGTGKTLLARAVATEAGVPFFSVSGSEFIELFVGVGSARTRDLFQTAKKNAPALVFIDELDAIGRQRGIGLGGAHEEREQTLNQILVEMDGFEPNSGIILLGATNRPDVLDPALLRPGRFDRRVVLDLPDLKDREEILRIHSRDKVLAKDINFKEIAERTPGFSGADLANLANEAAILAARRNKKEVEQTELRESIEKVLLGPERKSHILSKKEKEIAAYHEAGHALVNASLTHTDPVQKVSIIARGPAAGYTLKLPIQDRHLHSRSEFIDELAVFMGGYAAEKLVFNEITTGAANDLEKATDLARRLVTQYGMSEKLGPTTYGEREEIGFWGQELANKNYSEEVAVQIDKEITKFIDDAFQTAQKILTDKRKKLDQIAKKLIKKEAIERKEFERLMKKKVK